MPTQKKINIVSDFVEKLSSAKSVVFTDYRGLTTTQIEDLRRKIEETGGTFMVTKNTLLQLALQNAKYQSATGGPNSKLKEPTATLFAFTDEITPIKTLVKFAKEWELPTIKFGFLSKEFLGAERINELARLPGKNQLIANLIGQLQTPSCGLVNILESNLKNLVYLMQIVSEQKTNQGGDKHGR